MHSVQRQVALLAAVAWAMLLSGACASADRTGVTLDTAEDAVSSSTEPTPSTPSTLASTTTHVVVDASPQPLAGSAADDHDSADDALDTQLADIDEALDGGDLCGVYDGLAALTLDNSTVGVLVPQLTRIVEVMERARSLVDVDLIDDWDEVGADIGKVAAELHRHPNHTDSAAAVYDDPQYRSAQVAVDAALKETCG